MTDPEDARRALDALQRTQAEIVDRPTPRWTYGLAYGAICGLLVGGQGLPQPLSILTTAVGVCGLAVLVQWWRKATGYWVSGVSPKRARWVAISLGVVMLGLMAFNVWHGRTHGGWIVPVATGLVAGVIAIVAGELWFRVWRREVKAGRG